MKIFIVFNKYHKFWGIIVELIYFIGIELFLLYLLKEAQCRTVTIWKVGDFYWIADNTAFFITLAITLSISVVLGFSITSKFKALKVTSFMLVTLEIIFLIWSSIHVLTHRIR